MLNLANNASNLIRTFALNLGDTAIGERKTSSGPDSARALHLTVASTEVKTRTAR